MLEPLMLVTMLVMTLRLGDWEEEPEDEEDEDPPEDELD